jgi:hypothetical protein
MATGGCRASETVQSSMLAAQLAVLRVMAGATAPGPGAVLAQGAGPVSGPGAASVQASVSVSVRASARAAVRAALPGRASGAARGAASGAVLASVSSASALVRRAGSASMVAASAAIFAAASGEGPGAVLALLRQMSGRVAPGQKTLTPRSLHAAPTPPPFFPPSFVRPRQAKQHPQAQKMMRPAC